MVATIWISPPSSSSSALSAAGILVDTKTTSSPTAMILLLGSSVDAETLASAFSRRISGSALDLVEAEMRRLLPASSTLATLTFISCPTSRACSGSMSVTCNKATFLVLGSLGACTCRSAPKGLIMATVALINSPDTLSSLKPSNEADSSLVDKLKRFVAESTPVTRTFKTWSASRDVTSSFLAMLFTCSKPGINPPDGEVTPSITPMTSSFTFTGLMTFASNHSVFGRALAQSAGAGFMESFKRLVSASPPMTRTSTAWPMLSSFKADSSIWE
mmetsp:Transcript_27179/g.63237  ORF Transcript_27179/g.63237 Transcript_27179/m.63237 type:complete len:274 (+) Transcript_27179:993-1814(+)